MNVQPDLFEPRKRSRRADPQTSKDAAKFFSEAAISDHHRIIWTALQKHGPSTIYEISGHTGLEVHQVARRMKEMDGIGLVEVQVDCDGQQVVKKGETGRNCRVWRIA